MNNNNNVEEADRNKRITFEAYEKMKTTRYIFSKEDQEAIKSYLRPLKRELETGNIDVEKLIMLIKLADVSLDYDFSDENNFNLELFWDDLIESVYPGWQYYDSFWDYYEKSNDEEDKRIYEALYSECDGFYFRLRNWDRSDKYLKLTAEEERAFKLLLLPLGEELQTGNVGINRVAELFGLIFCLIGIDKPNLISFFHRLSWSILNGKQEM